jgi:hypothetical protein
MDPITTAVLSGIAAGATGGATAVAQQALVDAYSGLKGAIQRRFGADSDMAEAIAALEKKPDSHGRRSTLAEEVANAGADKDAEIVQAAEQVQAQVQQHPHAQQIFNAINSNVGVMGTNYGNVNMDNRQQSLFNQSGQHVQGSQYNAGGDMSFGDKNDTQ